MSAKINQHETLLKNDNERLKEVEEDTKVILKSQLTMLDHMITNNSIEKMKETRKEIQEYLIGGK